MTSESLRENETVNDRMFRTQMVCKGARVVDSRVRTVRIQFQHHTTIDFRSSLVIS